MKEDDVNMVSLRRILGLKQNVDDMRDSNQESIQRMEEEKKERQDLDSRLEAMSLELDNMARSEEGARKEQP